MSFYFLMLALWLVFWLSLFLCVFMCNSCVRDQRITRPIAQVHEVLRTSHIPKGRKKSGHVLSFFFIRRALRKRRMAWSNRAKHWQNGNKRLSQVTCYKADTKNDDRVLCRDGLLKLESIKIEAESSCLVWSGSEVNMLCCTRSWENQLVYSRGFADTLQNKEPGTAFSHNRKRASERKDPDTN